MSSCIRGTGTTSSTVVTLWRPQISAENYFFRLAFDCSVHVHATSHSRQRSWSYDLTTLYKSVWLLGRPAGTARTGSPALGCGDSYTSSCRVCTWLDLSHLTSAIQREAAVSNCCHTSLCRSPLAPRQQNKQAYNNRRGKAVPAKSLIHILKIASTIM